VSVKHTEIVKTKFDFATSVLRSSRTLESPRRESHEPLPNKETI
jgi:hypothetical protein